MKKYILLIALFSISISFAQEGKNKEQEKIIEEFLTNCAEKYYYTIQMSDWQNCLDNGLAKDSTIAYLWQQKAMPYFKARKYEVGMPFLDKAVKYNAERWQPYRGFMKCIFSKSYKDAIEDLEDCKKKFGNGYVMDHTYDFYIALSYLQLNEFEKAEKILQNYVDEIYKDRDKLEHPTAYFYLGIAKFELKKFDEAITVFDKALKVYPNFSDVKFYKAICLIRNEKIEEAKILLKESEADYKIGYKLNEDNTIYETYPYQKKWDKQ
jgi:tetratricopeptide (TPR) repeat protein